MAQRRSQRYQAQLEAAANRTVMRKKRQRGAMVGAMVVVLIAIGYMVWSNSTQQSVVQDTTAMHKVEIQTPRGNIVMELYPDKMPITVSNFAKLVRSKFYDGLTFHRVEDFCIQGGDPNGNGSGGPGWTIKLETDPTLTNLRGMVAMARRGDPDKDSAGSQFYILKQDTPSLDGGYAVFGKVLSGMDVVDKIQVGDKMTSVKEIK